MRRGPAIALLAAAVAALPAAAAHTAVRNYTTAQGLPQAQVNALAQDGAGFLWAGTQAGGLGRYDGHAWTLFDASNGLPGTGINALAVDPEGRLVVATSGGAVRLEGSSFRPVGPATSVIAIAAQPHGRVWLGTFRGVLLVPSDGAAPQPVPGEPALAEDTILALASDGAGGVWVGSRGGLGHVSGTGTPRLERVPGLPAGGVGALLARPGRPLLAAVSQKGLYEQDGTAFRRVGDDAVPGRQVVGLLAESEEPDAIWIATADRGAYRWRGSAFEPFGTAEGLASPIVYSLLEDREGILWFGTDAGLTKRGPSAFLTFDAADGFPPGQAIYGMAQSRDGALWFAGWESGVVRMSPDGAVRRFTHADGLPDDRVTDVAAHPRSGVWVGTFRGLAWIDGDRVTVPPEAARAPGRIRSLLALPDGTLAIGTASDGLALLHPDGTIERPAGVGPDIGALFRGPDGTLWCGGDGWGAVGLRPGGGRVHLTRKEGLPSDQVTGGLVDADGRLWIATDRGAFCRESSGATRVVDRRSGLPDTYVYWVGQEPHGALWFGTNRGAVRWPPGAEMEVYTSRDGLGSDECNEDGFFVDTSGRVFIATVGVSLFLGRPRPRRAVDPPVLVDEVLVSGRPAPDFGKRPLPPRPGPITFRFAALSFTDEGAIRFRHRLVGLSDAWTETEPGQYETTWAGLPPGEYRFEVAARTVDGRVSRVPASVSFRVRAPWWRTPASLGSFGAALVLGLVGFVRFREARLLAMRARLEREVAERTEELRRANERLEALAVTDELTGLANRRRVLARLEEAISFARRTRTTLAIALADLDRFKEVNDTLGHEAGDRFLVAAARAMQGELRTEDLLGRYGGEEFLAVLPGSDAAGAFAAGERMRTAVAAIAADPRLGFAPTVSVGVAACDDPQLDAAELIRRADAALYAAKAGGRDRVESWERVPQAR